MMVQITPTDTDAPNIQLLSSSSSSKESLLLVCVVSRLSTPLLDVLWWVNDTLVTSAGTNVSVMTQGEGGAYNVASLWQVSVANTRTQSVYWCGTVVDGRVHRQRLAVCPP